MLRHDLVLVGLLEHMRPKARLANLRKPHVSHCNGTHRDGNVVLLLIQCIYFRAEALVPAIQAIEDRKYLFELRREVLSETARQVALHDDTEHGRSLVHVRKEAPKLLCRRVLESQAVTAHIPVRFTQGVLHCTVALDPHLVRSKEELLRGYTTYYQYHCNAAQYLGSVEQLQLEGSRCLHHRASGTYK